MVPHICAVRRLSTDSLGPFYWLRITGSHCKGSVMAFTVQRAVDLDTDICVSSTVLFPGIQLLKSLDCFM